MKLNDYVNGRTIARMMYDSGEVDEARKFMADLKNRCGEYLGIMDRLADSIDAGNITPDLRDCPFARDAELYDSALRAAGVFRFTISAASTGLLEFMEAMEFRGWHVTGMTEVFRFRNDFDEHKFPAIIIDLGE